MKNKLRALALTVFIGGSVLFAQEKNAQDMISKKVDRMAKELSLTQEQRKEVYAIHVKYADRMMAMHETKKEKASKKATREALRKDINKDLESVLTPEQMKKAEAFRRDRRSGPNKRVDGKGKHLEHMARELNLSDVQRKQMKAIHRKQMESMRAIRAMDISDAEKKTRIEALKKEMRKSYENVFRKDQLKKFRAMRKMEHKKSEKNWTEPAK